MTAEELLEEAAEVLEAIAMKLVCGVGQAVQNIMPACRVRLFDGAEGSERDNETKGAMRRDKLSYYLNGAGCCFEELCGAETAHSLQPENAITSADEYYILLRYFDQPSTTNSTLGYAATICAPQNMRRNLLVLKME